ncbi:PP2C family protein-serine/threonine phosphatase [Nitrosophilus alvini]|uniref:PP2C family protein-serine/threonine phosphatase n=1 Tax=Nitrosophilus alvini TaxID=2714855 RepID=UPI00190D679D|nr:protein phosphatase 2C domain-containing protein [Nitrosophilus alvini]
MYINAYYTTNIGSKKFSKNQDAILLHEKIICNTSLPGVAFKSFDKSSLLFAVADGVSAHRYSEFASCKVLNLLMEKFFKNSIIKVIRDIQEELETLSIHSRKLNGASTTLAGVNVEHDKATIFHTGDSRVYLIRDKKLKLLTTDHTQANAMLKKGEITEEEFRNLSNIYSMLIGYLVYGENDNLPVDVTKIHFGYKDILLICTDGVNDSLNDNEIESIFKSDDLNTQAQTLFQKISQKEIDNFSFIIISNDLK